MEKYGIESVENIEMKKLGEKRVRNKDEFECDHPDEVVEKDGDIKFCQKCGKYLP